MRILFIGCVESSYILLNELINNEANICGVVTKKKSKLNSDFYDLAPLCITNNIEYIYSKNTEDYETINFIQEKKPDIIYCFGWSFLLNIDIIRVPKLGVVGFHPAKLPYNKGRHPLIWALVLGLQSTASSFFMIDEKVDNGDIISQVDISIEFKDDARSLYDKVMKVAKEQIMQITNSFLEGSINYFKQNSNVGNIWRKRNKNDGKIDFRMSSNGIYNLVRGLTRPYVGAHIEYKGCDYKVWETKIIDSIDNKYINIEPGKVISVNSTSSFVVKTYDGIIEILESDDIDLKEGDYL
jgi:methionyl-tRNA formyltransferase